VTEIPDWLSSTLAADATGGAHALAPWVKALRPGMAVTGRALVAAVTRDDNSPMRDVPAAVPGPGTVLVVAGAGESRTAILGDLVARELLAAGVVGVVTDGLVRDADAVVDLGLLVWSRGVTTTASRKDGHGFVGGQVPIAGVVMADGDLVVADSDGVVVWPADQVETLLAAAAHKQAADDARLSALR
jgi:regulator of RNase E activity RraA